jgi:hypothetical protein
MKCPTPKCNGIMKPGIAMKVAVESRGMYFLVHSFQKNWKTMAVLKCDKCGYSEK